VDAALFDVGDQSAALIDRGVEIEHVEPGCGGGVQLDVFLRQIFGELFRLKEVE